MISGSYPPEPCGVGDYTKKIFLALKDTKINIQILTNTKWSILQIFEIFKKINKINPDIIHIQFPSAGFGYGIVPQILSLKYKTIVTVHEVSAFHPLRKAWLVPFSIKSEIVFTSLFEYKTFKKIFPWYNKKAIVIPIGSNLDDFFENYPDFKDRNPNTIIYFGLIRPKKGIEDVIQLAGLLKEASLNYRVKIIGQVLDKNLDYFIQLKKSAADLPVDWAINLSATMVSAELAKHVIAYLPFPDGASERRGSLFATMKSQMLIYTTKGVQTPIALDKTVTYIKTPAELLYILRNSTPDDFNRQFVNKNEAIKSFITSIEWPKIATKHLDLYDSYFNL